MDRTGKHRQTLRRLVAEAEGDPMGAAQLVGDWWREREREEGAAFLDSVMEELGPGNVPAAPEIDEAVEQAWTAAAGDEARFEAILLERIDPRKTPGFRATAWRVLWRRLFRQVIKALQEEIERYHEERQR